MRQSKWLLTLTAICLMTSLVGCPEDGNSDPVACAGADFNVSVCRPVTLDGSCSSGSSLSFAWRQVAGQAGGLSNSASAISSFTAPASGTYVFELIVTDNAGQSDVDQVTVSVDASTLDALSSTFNAGDDGWRLVGGQFSSPATPASSATGGAPNGHIFGQNLTGDAYWSAPPAFRGDKSCCFGQTLSFDLNSSVSPAAGCADLADLVTITGGGLTLAFDAPYYVENTWTNFTIRFDDGQGWIVSETNQPATAAQLRQVLATLTELRIRAWMFGCNVAGDGGLDNIILGGSSVPLSPPVRSDFASDADGWTVAGGSFGRNGSVTHSPSNGSPEGYALAIAQDDWYWMAPPKFRGDASKAYGNLLKFDLNRAEPFGYNPQITTTSIVILEGGGHRLHSDSAYWSDQTWTGYAVRLSETALWYDESNKRATVDVMKGVLSDLKQLKIRGSFQWGQNGAGGIDNVQLVMEGDQLSVVSSPHSHFDESADGWTVAGGSFGNHGPVAWNASGGEIGPYVSTTGQDEFYWMAPPKFRGDASQAYGGALTFALKWDAVLGWNPQMTTDRLVVLDGGGHEIYFDAASLPPQTWTRFSVGLTESALWYQGLGAARARVSADTMKAVLADLQQVRIRSWFQLGNNGTAGLDSVNIDPP